MTIAQSRVDGFKRRAKFLKKTNNTALHVEQNNIARAEGFPNGSMLMRELSKAGRHVPAPDLIDALCVRFKGALDEMRPRTVQLLLNGEGHSLQLPAFGMLLYVDDIGNG